MVKSSGTDAPPRAPRPPVAAAVARTGSSAIRDLLEITERPDVLSLAGKRALLVASTDLSHFYPHEIAEQLDKTMLQQIADFSPEGVFRAEESGAGFACGFPAVAAVLWAARALGGNAVRVLHHSTSADETGDASQVVGYGAAAILKKDSH